MIYSSMPALRWAGSLACLQPRKQPAATSHTGVSDTLFHAFEIKQHLPIPSQNLQKHGANLVNRQRGGHAFDRRSDHKKRGTGFTLIFVTVAIRPIELTAAMFLPGRPFNAFDASDRLGLFNSSGDIRSALRSR